MRRTAPGIAFALLVCGVVPARAQCGIGPEPCRPDAPRWVGEFASLSANAVLGGLTAGLSLRLRGGSFGDGFLRGLIGGSGVYTGKRIAAERFHGAGLLGRQVAAVGTSVVGNAGRGERLFDRLALPLGPVWIEFAGEGLRPSGARIDAIALGWIAYAVIEPELHFDAGRSLSAGTPVFRTDGTVLSFGGNEAHAAGVTQAGVVLLADVPPYGEAFLERSFAHERVHVLQMDFMGAVWTDPLTRLVLDRIGVPETVAGAVRFNLSSELLRGLGRLIPEHEHRPWETESIFLAR